MIRNAHIQRTGGRVRIKIWERGCKKGDDMKRNGVKEKTSLQICIVFFFKWHSDHQNEVSVALYFSCFLKVSTSAQTLSYVLKESASPPFVICRLDNVVGSVWPLFQQLLSYKNQPDTVLLKAMNLGSQETGSFSFWEDLDIQHHI